MAVRVDEKSMRKVSGEGRENDCVRVSEMRSLPSAVQVSAAVKLAVPFSIFLSEMDLRVMSVPSTFEAFQKS